MFFTKPLLLALSLLTTGAAAASTETTAPVPTREAGQHRSEGKGLCAQIGCTDAQQEKIAAIRKAAHEELRALHAKDGDDRSAFADAIRDDDLTPAEVKALLAKREAEADARRDVMARTVSEIHAVLDAKQREQVASIVETRGIKALVGGGHHGKGKRGGKAKANDRDKGPELRGGDGKGKPDGKGKGKGKGKAKGKPERGR